MLLLEKKTKEREKRRKNVCGRMEGDEMKRRDKRRSTRLSKAEGRDPKRRREKGGKRRERNERGYYEGERERLSKKTEKRKRMDQSEQGGGIGRERRAAVKDCPKREPQRVLQVSSCCLK